MIIKQCQFPGKDERGEYIHVVHPGYKNEHLIKVAQASPPQLELVQQFLKDHPRSETKLYTLLSALGAGEFWGSNSNGDWFGLEALLHTPPGWAEMPQPNQRIVGAKWEWGYPTFYNAHAFAHHVNKDPARSFGEVEYVIWDDAMKRVLLVVAFDRDKAKELGSHGILDRVDNGEFPDVSMGCFPAGTLVTLGDGTRVPIEQIKEGDEIISHTGRKRKVLKTHQRKYKGELYSIRAEAHRVIRCTRQHPFLAVAEEEVKFKDQHNNWNWRNLVKEPFPEEWIHAECLHDQYLLEPIMYGPPLDKHELPEGGRAFARVLGYYLAEGHLVRNKKGELAGIELTTNRSDPIHDEITELCVQLGTDNAPSFRPRDNSEESIAISIFDKHLAKGMLECAGVYSTEKKLAEGIMLWPKELLLELLGAYANGDGCGYDGTIKFSTASESLAWQLVALLPRVGAIPSVSQLKHKAGSGMSRIDTYEWVVHVGKQWAPILASYSKKVVPVEVQKTKRSRFLAENLGRIITPIREIESMYVETEVFNLEVEEDESYLVEGLAVHNCKVPYDVCSRCADWSRITGNPKTDLEEHRRSPIRGLSVVTADYCQHLRFEINKIYPDGVQAKMINLHPKFFDISVVFIGADKTSKILAKLAHGRCPIQDRAACKSCIGSCGAVPSAHVYEVWSRDTKVKEAKSTLVKYAQDYYVDPAEEREVSAYFDKKQHNKQAEIIKQVRSQFSESALPALAQGEPGLPLGLQSLMSESLPDALSTAGSLGIVATPEEFQRMALSAVGSKALADQLDQSGICFEPGEPPSDTFGLSGRILPDLISALAPLIEGRSALGPALSRRITIVSIGGTGMKPHTMVSDTGPQIRGACPHHELLTSPETEPLLKLLSGQYGSYRKDLIDKAASLVKRAMRERPDVFEPYLMPRLIDAFAAPLAKVGTDVLESLVGMLTTDYLNQIHMPRPISTYVHKHAGLGGISRAGELARFGGVA